MLHSHNVCVCISVLSVLSVCVCVHTHMCVCVCVCVQPPLPEEDYPADDYPTEVDLPEEELLAVSPVTPHSFPKDYTPSHVTRAVIPRASLDRSAPTGWNLNIDPDGTWVFSNRHSPDQVHRLFLYLDFIYSG